jgi:U3 small nucleolar RNA-associated protein 14
VIVVPLPCSFHFTVYLQERAMKKHEEATYEEARQTLKEYDESLRKLEDGNSDRNEDSIMVTGKRTFGPVKNTHAEVNKRQKLEDSDKNNDSEYDSDPAQHLENNEVTKKRNKIQLGTALLDEPRNAMFEVIFSFPLIILSCHFCYHKKLIYGHCIM